MEEKKNKNKSIVAIIVLLSLIVGMLGYLVISHDQMAKMHSQEEMSSMMDKDQLTKDSEQEHDIHHPKGETEQ